MGVLCRRPIAPGLKAAFSVDEYIDVILHVQELARLRAEAISAIEARNIGYVGFYDCSGASMGAIMGMMECKYFADGDQSRLFVRSCSPRSPNNNRPAVGIRCDRTGVSLASRDDHIPRQLSNVRQDVSRYDQGGKWIHVQL